MSSNKKNNLITIIILSVIFGIAAGAIGGLAARVWLLDEFLDIPFYGEINFSDGSYQGSNIVITGAKRVVVEQNDKVIETINSVQSSLAGIYKKNLLREPVGETSKFDLGSYYKLEDEIAQGIIITSDGWILSSYRPENLNYAVITRDKKIYSIDKIISDTLTPFHFLHVSAKDLPVRKFAEKSDMNNGQAVIAVNWEGEAALNSIVNSNKKNGGILNFSDSFNSSIELAEDLKENFRGSFLFNLSGDVIGLSDQGGRVEPIGHFRGAIQSLLKEKKVVRPGLGVNYIDLSRLVSAIPKSTGEGEYKNGALIYKSAAGISAIKGGPADKAGLKEGDIIISVDGIEVNQTNDLADVIQGHTAGDSIIIKYLRNGKESETEVILGEAGV